MRGGGLRHEWQCKGVCGVSYFASPLTRGHLELMQTQTIFLHTLVPDSDIGFRSVGAEFPAKAYSRFKYGEDAAASAFGEALAGRVLEELPWFGPEDASGEIILTASASKAVPTAAHAAAMHARAVLDGRLAAQGREPMGGVRIVRENLFAGEYERLSTAARRDVLSHSGLHLEGPTLTGARLLVIDDIRVSGTHEAAIRALLAPTGVAEVCFAYLAGFAEPPAQADVEHRLNAAEIDSLGKLQELLLTSSVTINVRVGKRILLWPTLEELADFLTPLPMPLLLQLQAGLLVDGFDRLAAYSAPFEVLAQSVRERVGVRQA
jgi:PRTase ComF-like